MSPQNIKIATQIESYHLPPPARRVRRTACVPSRRRTSHRRPSCAPSPVRRTDYADWSWVPDQNGPSPRPCDSSTCPALCSAARRHLCESRTGREIWDDKIRRRRLGAASMRVAFRRRFLLGKRVLDDWWRRRTPTWTRDALYRPVHTLSWTNRVFVVVFFTFTDHLGTWAGKQSFRCSAA